MKVYLDYNGTTPVAKEVQEIMARVIRTCWGNPSSSHSAGKAAGKILEEARCRTAEAINASPSEIVFTSGGTESNNMVLLGAACANSPAKRHIITSKIEHPSVLNPCIHLLEQGWDITFVGVDESGVVNTAEIEAAIGSNTALISIMLANNETGVIQPIEKICDMAHRHGVPVHTDAAQAVGKMPVDVNRLGADYLTVAGHKLYAPKGIGALYVKKGSPWQNLMFGAGQEHGMRPGTEPVHSAAAIGEACRLVTSDLAMAVEKMKKLRDRLFQLLQEVSDSRVYRYGEPDNTLCNTLLVSFPGRIGSEILTACPDLMASTGAACHDRQVAISHVLAAMHVPEEVAMGTLRLTLGRYTTETDITQAAELIRTAL